MAIDNQELDGLPQAIREAVAAGEFSKARLLWVEYGERFRAALSHGPLAQSRLTEARELAEWTRIAALCARAHAHSRLNQIAVSQRYGWPADGVDSRVAARF